jgi:hypothetical protein
VQRTCILHNQTTIDYTHFQRMQVAERKIKSYKTTTKIKDISTQINVYVIMRTWLHIIPVTLPVHYTILNYYIIIFCAYI